MAFLTVNLAKWRRWLLAYVNAWNDEQLKLTTEAVLKKPYLL